MIFSIRREMFSLRTIYADNAATTKPGEAAIRAMLPFYTELWGNPSSLYSFGQEAAAALVRARESVAAAIGAKPREITFTSGGSEADNQAIRSAAAAGAKKDQRHILSTAFEHHAVLHTLNALKKEGYEIELLPVGENGLIAPEAVAAAIRPDTCLVSVMFANNEIGTLQPIAEIGAVCREKNVLFHTDAVQAVGHVPVDVQTLNADYLAASAHKFRGPKGAGFLWTRQGAPLKSLIEGGAQERGRRAGTENTAGIAGMAAALTEAVAHLEENAEKTAAVRDRLIEGIARIPHCVLNGDRFARVPGNVSFCFEGIEGESLLLLLDDRGICASSGSACTSGSLEPSHVLLAIGRPHEIAHGSLRLSIDETLTPADADYVIETVADVVARLRGMSPVWRDLQAGKKEFITT